MCGELQTRITPTCVAGTSSDALIKPRMDIEKVLKKLHTAVLIGGQPASNGFPARHSVSNRERRYFLASLDLLQFTFSNNNCAHAFVHTDVTSLKAHNINAKTPEVKSRAVSLSVPPQHLKHVSRYAALLVPMLLGIFHSKAQSVICRQSVHLAFHLCAMSGYILNERDRGAPARINSSVMYGGTLT